MALKIHVFDIVGIKPLLMHNPAGMQRPKGGISKKTIPSPEEEAEAGSYRNEDRTFYLTSDAFRSALLGGCKGKRIGKVAASGPMSAGVSCAEERCNLIHPKTRKPLKEFKIDTRRAVVQGNGVLRSRPRLDEWATEVALEIDDDFVTPALVEEVLNLSGRMCGAGDYRPECRGPFGKFTAKLRK